MGRVGAVVESPKFSPNFTGRQNLRLLARSVGVGDARVDQAVDALPSGQLPALAVARGGALATAPGDERGALAKLADERLHP